MPKQKEVDSFSIDLFKRKITLCDDCHRILTDSSLPPQGVYICQDCKYQYYNPDSTGWTDSDWEELHSR